MFAVDAATHALPHFAGLSWRLDVPRASRANAALTAVPTYSVKLTLAEVHPSSVEPAVSPAAVKLRDVTFSCPPETLVALATAIEAAVRQSEMPPYRRVARMIR